MVQWRRRRGRDSGETGIPQPYLDLAREIHDQIARAAADPSADAELLTELIDRMPDDQRMQLARAVFDNLSPEQQWAIIERVYGDADIRRYLEAEREARLAESRLNATRVDLCRTARARKALDTQLIAPDDELTLGLFRGNDVRAAVVRGHTSSTCARRLVLRAVGDGKFQVIEDTFNPNGGYFVTAEYSEDTWRQHDRLDGHAVVRVGSITDAADGGALQPVLYPAGRVDFEIGGNVTRGLLSLGFAMLSDLDIFVP